MNEYFEVWVTDYNTFGESDSYIRSRYRSREAAEFEAAYLNNAWGTRAQVRRVGDPEIRDIDVRDLKNEMIEQMPFAKRELEAIWDRHRKSRP